MSVTAVKSECKKFQDLLDKSEGRRKWSPASHVRIQTATVGHGLNTFSENMRCGGNAKRTDEQIFFIHACIFLYILLGMRPLIFINPQGEREPLKASWGMTEAGWQGSNWWADLTAYQRTSCAAVETVSLKRWPQLFQSQHSIRLLCQQPNWTNSGVIFVTTVTERTDGKEGRDRMKQRWREIHSELSV